MQRIVAFVILSLFGLPYRTDSVDAQLTPIKISYATTSGTRLPLWIAQDARLFEKYGLDAKSLEKEAHKQGEVVWYA